MKNRLRKNRLRLRFSLRLRSIAALTLASALTLISTLTSSVFGHPGATDKNGCHKVTKDYKYLISKKVLKAGTTHCHSELGKMRLGKDILEDPWDAGEEVAPVKGKKSK